MMQHRAQNPGSIHVRFAALQQKAEEAVAVGNLVLYANILRRMRLYASVVMDDDQKREYDAMPGLSEDSRSTDQVYEDLCLKEEFLLSIVKDYDVFIKGRHQKGDASSLDDMEEEAIPA